MPATILTIDVGTTSVKISIYSKELHLLKCIHMEYSLDSEDVFVQVPAARYLDAITYGIAQLDGLEQVAAIGITTQGETLIPVDYNGSPLCPAIVWLDRRAGKQAKKLGVLLDEMDFYKTTGLPEIGDALPLSKILWIQEEKPELFSQTYKFLLLEDYILWWLTGHFVTEKSLQTSTGWFDIQNDTYWQTALLAAGIDQCKFPELLECGQAVGTILQDRAVALNLPESTIIVTGAMDQTAAALAAGCTQAGTVTETTGTALVMAACTDNPVFSETHRLTVYRHALPGKYLYLPIGNTAGMALKWFRNEFCRDLSGEDSYSLMGDMAGSVPSGCNGLLFLPYLSGCVNPDFLPWASGVFYGAHLSSTRAHFIRAILESTAYQIADFLSLLDSKGCKADTVISLGGGACSSIWLQMKADICERPFQVPDCSEATSTGAALLAAQGAGLFTSKTYPKLTFNKQYLPQPELFKTYRRQRKCFQEVYNTIKPLYKGEDDYDE